MVDWTELLVTVVGLLFTAIIIPLVKVAFSGIKSKNVRDELTTEAERIVLSLNQTVVGELKSKSADGKLTAQEAEEVLQSAVHQMFADVSDSAIKYVNKKAVDINEYFAGLIEAAVAKAKQ